MNQTDFYTQFYKKTENSEVHSEFCRSGFGIDLNQHGFADIEQLNLILEITSMSPAQNVLDIGCGNGMIAEYLSHKSGARVTGIDSCKAAILQAQRRTKDSRLVFQQGDINDLCLPDIEYDTIILIDSIYFSNDYRKTIQTLKNSLIIGGRVLIFYAIGPSYLGSDEFSVEILEAENTPLAVKLKESGMSQLNIDLTEQDLKLAKIRKGFLEKHQASFLRENIEFIYENRIDEANGIISAINLGKHRRYLYCAQGQQYF